MAVPLSVSEVLDFFRSGLRQGNLYHTFLLLSPDPSLSSHLALRIAWLLSCHAGVDEAPCGKCPACVKAKASLHPDISIVGGEKSAAIDEVREMARQVHVKAWEGAYKINILQDSHNLREEAANALLKILEEPPAQSVFLLTAENEHRVIPTVVSRCQVFHVGETTEDVADILVRQHGVDPKQAQTLSHLGEGTLSGAMQVKTIWWENRNELFRLFLEETDPVEAGESFAESCGTGEDGRRATLIFLAHFASFWRDVLVSRLHGSDEWIINSDLTRSVRQIEAAANPAGIFEFLEFLVRAGEMVRHNVSLSLIWENVFLAAERTSGRNRRGGKLCR